MVGPRQMARAAVTSWITNCDRIGDAEHAGTGSDLDCQIQHVLNIKLQASNGLTGSASKIPGVKQAVVYVMSSLA